ncbi:MAG: hypothetical protein M3P44_13070, partial [Actinomycetota bacterium]|nr:hypothetical protein [Actinomycetota bacterium]
HLNAVERIALLADEPLRSAHLAEAASGERLLGVWGADPAPGEGDPAEIRGDALHGIKTFCSGAGALVGALVVARGGDERRVAYVDLGFGVEIDRDWFAASGMRASETRRVVFRGARIHAVLGGPGELGREPWFGRDSLRTTATWAGLADAAAAGARDVLAPRVQGGDELAALALGRISVHEQAVELLMAEAGWCRRHRDG